MKSIGFLLMGLTLLTFTIIKVIEDSISWSSEHGGSYSIDLYIYFTLVIVFTMGLFAFLKGKD
ncbi:hypothetical protein ABEW00_02875 [Rossellomorea vietnamensis]|jgi:hypothetical protein|uniref:hypothetical protein n=1 Tax=Rossellomorea vietnamensis TaxID=218284 RepID=UPI003D2BCFC3